MVSLATRSQAFSARLWRNDAPLTATAGVMLVAFAGCVVGLLVDPRLVLGAPVWLKPAKFAVSIALYSVSLAWLFGYLPAFVRTRRIVGRVTAIALLLEMVIISGQAARGTTSHFNVSSPFNTALFAIMGLAIVAQTLSTVAVAVALFRQRFDDPALGWSLRLGLVLTIAGAFIGGIMTRPTEVQVRMMHAGEQTPSGSHTVGGPDGGRGMPVTGWSREHGDLRVPHFVGLHALQVLPLLALVLRRTRVSTPKRARLVVALGVSYATFAGILLWQALHGRPFIASDLGSVAALGAWAFGSGLLVWRSLTASVSSQRAALVAS